MRKGVQGMTILIVLMLALIVGAIFFASSSDVISEALDGISEMVGLANEKESNIKGNVEDTLAEGMEKAKRMAKERQSSQGSGNPSSNGTESNDSSSTDSWKVEADPNLKPSQKFNVYFMPKNTQYAKNNPEEYKQRANTYFQSLHDRTPLGECKMGEKKIVMQPSAPDKKYDLRVFLTGKNECNAAHVTDGGSEYMIMHKGVDNIAADTVLPHEFGHMFGLCDVYLQKTYNKQNSNDYASQGGCGNDLPKEWGWYPSGSVVPANSPVKQCGYNDAVKSTSMPGGGMGPGGQPAGYCGKDLDEDTDTQEASIMGGGGAWKLIKQADGTLQCPERAIEQPAFTEKAFNHMKQQLAKEGFECVPK